MLAKRIIPCLDVKEGRVVKGVNFIGLQDVGDPVEIAEAYNEAGADEIVFLDITATHEGRKTIIDVVEKQRLKYLFLLRLAGDFKCERYVQFTKSWSRQSFNKLSGSAKPEAYRRRDRTLWIAVYCRGN